MKSKTYEQYQAYATAAFEHEPDLIFGLMAIEFVCDVVDCDRECLEFALKGDNRYREKFFCRLNQVLDNNPERELFVKLLKDELEIMF